MTSEQALQKSSAPSKDKQQSIMAMLQDLPSTANGFSQFDASLQSDKFCTYLSSAADKAAGCYEIKTEKTRCLIRALKAMSTAEPSAKKRSLSVVLGADKTEPVKRARWSTLAKEQKQACIRIALTAACAHRGNVALENLRAGWAENPRRKQLINADVRRAICQSVELWSVDELGDYMSKSGLTPSRSIQKMDMVRAVRAHLAPSEKEVVSRE